MANPCPTTEELLPQALALLPRGRAWGNHDGAPSPTSPRTRFFKAVADVYAFLARRLCDLNREMFCATQSETNADWLFDYGLPDDCDPFPDLCAKVSARGGASCDYLAEVAARAGWAITCAGECAGVAGCFEAGCSTPGMGLVNGSFVIVIDAANSPAYVPAESIAEAGCLEAGVAIRCDPLEGLRCILDRVIQAHRSVSYLILEE